MKNRLAQRLKTEENFTLGNLKTTTPAGSRRNKLFLGLAVPGAGCQNDYGCGVRS